MTLSFEKYQGTGNDFIMLDNRDGKWNDLSISLIQKICDRRFGVGADGLIKINTLSGYDFEVDYYNSDGSKSFCGNGARCAVAFAHRLGITADSVLFMAIDGVHEAEKKNGLVYLKMQDVDTLDDSQSDFVLNTGSPHYIHFTEQVADFDIFSFGRKVRYSDRYRAEGINVNAVHQLDEHTFEIRTYERGVEDETLSCGTGVTAAALALARKNGISGSCQYQVKAQGGDLAVQFTVDETRFREIWLIGPAEYVFKGDFHV